MPIVAFVFTAGALRCLYAYFLHHRSPHILRTFICSTPAWVGHTLLGAIQVQVWLKTTGCIIVANLLPQVFLGELGPRVGPGPASRGLPGKRLEQRPQLVLLDVSVPIPVRVVCVETYRKSVVVYKTLFQPNLQVMFSA